MGLIHRVRAVKLANAGQVSEALLATEQSLAHKPNDVEARKLRQQLREVLERLQQQVALLSKSLAGRPNASLTEEGQ